MISVLRFFFLASGVFAATSGTNSPLPHDVMRLGSIALFDKMIRVTAVARKTLKSQLSFI